MEDPLGKFQISVICLEFLWYFLTKCWKNTTENFRLSGIPVVFFDKMLEKYHRKFQTDDENLEFAEETLWDSTYF